MKGMTKRQRQIVDYIDGYIGEQGYSPSYREIMKHFGFSSLGSVYKHISVLKRRGVLSAEKNSARSVVLVQGDQKSVKGQTIELPFLGMIAAGSPLETFPQAGTMCVPSGMVQKPEDSFVLQVRGDSMGDGIQEGDLVIVQSSSSARPGDTVVALIDGNETTLKRYFLDGNNVRLEPANPSYQPIVVAKDRVTIQGLLRGLIRRYA